MSLLFRSSLSSGGEEANYDSFGVLVGNNSEPQIAQEVIMQHLENVTYNSQFNEPLVIGDNVTNLGRGLLQQCSAYNCATTIPVNVINCAGLLERHSNYDAPVVFKSTYLRDASNFLTMDWQGGSFNKSVDFINVWEARDLSSAFLNQRLFNSPINVTIPSPPEGHDGDEWPKTRWGNCSHMFFGCSNFNQPISNVSFAGDCSEMFLSSKFNQPIDLSADIEGWSVTNCVRMFTQSPFNNSITFPEYSEDVNYSQMFLAAHSFNQPVTLPEAQWCDYSNMFQGLYNFNSSVTIPNQIECNFSNMFLGIPAFNAPINFAGHMENCDFSYILNGGYPYFNQTIDLSDTENCNWNHAFCGCYNLKEIILPNNVSDACRMLPSSIEMDITTLPNVTSENGSYAELFDRCNNITISEPLTIPNGPGSINCSGMFSTSSFGNMAVAPITFSNDTLDFSCMFGYLGNGNGHALGGLFNQEINIPASQYGDEEHPRNTAGMLAHLNNFNAPVTFEDFGSSGWGMNSNCSRMFMACYSFNQPITIPTDFRDASYMFAECPLFNQYVDEGYQLENCSHMFANCTNFDQTIYLSSQLKNSSYMFDNCINFNTFSNPEIEIDPGMIPINCSHMFNNCTNLNLESVYLGSKCEDLSYMFANCLNLIGYIYIDDADHSYYDDNGNLQWITRNCSHMFANCTNLSGNIHIQYGTSNYDQMFWNTPNVTDIYFNLQGSPFTRFNFTNILDTASLNTSIQHNLHCASFVDSALCNYILGNEAWTNMEDGNGYYNTQYNLYIYNNLIIDDDGGGKVEPIIKP